MAVRAPHFLLYSEARRRKSLPDWRFVLEAADGSAKLEAADSEPLMQGERLELLAVVRGLEALDQPSSVTIYTPSRYVSRGLRFGLSEWRTNGWRWERYGQMVPVKDQDLWRRVDRALQFHQVECRTWQVEPAHALDRAVTAPDRGQEAGNNLAGIRALLAPVGGFFARPRRFSARRAWLTFRHWLTETCESWHLWLKQSTPGVLPHPWLD